MPSSDEKLLSAIAHICIFFNILGLIVTVIIYVIKGKESLFINFSTKQALGWQIFSILIHNVIGFLTFGSLIGGITMGMNPIKGFLGFFGINGIISLIFIIFSLIAAIKALSGEKYRYPVIGSFVAKI